MHGDGLCVSCRLNGRLGRQRDSVALESRDLDDLAAELSGQFLHVYNVPVFPYDVDHVDGYNNGDAELGELGRQIEISLKVRAVDNIQYRVGALAEEEVTGNDLLESIRG